VGVGPAQLQGEDARATTVAAATLPVADDDMHRAVVGATAAHAEAVSSMASSATSAAEADSAVIRHRNAASARPRGQECAPSRHPPGWICDIAVFPWSEQPSAPSNSDPLISRADPADTGNPPFFDRSGQQSRWVNAGLVCGEIHMGGELRIKIAPSSR
jgi:phage-related tail fiber protein